MDEIYEKLFSIEMDNNPEKVYQELIADAKKNGNISVEKILEIKEILEASLKKYNCKYSELKKFIDKEDEEIDNKKKELDKMTIEEYEKKLYKKFKSNN